ncbi:hypothetical protein [Lysobacter humi (ex Lee et al. 2017)]
MDAQSPGPALRRRRARSTQAARFVPGVRPQPVDPAARMEFVLAEDVAGRLVLLDPWHPACETLDAADDVLLLGVAPLATRHLRPATLVALQLRGRVAIEGAEACNALLAFIADAPP